MRAGPEAFIAICDPSNHDDLLPNRERRRLGGEAMQLAGWPNFSETSWIVTISVLGGVAIAWAIVVCVITVSKIVVRHRERMAQIGMDLNSQRTSATVPHPNADSAIQSEWSHKSAAG
jgi:hypothetical protein